MRSACEFVSRAIAGGGRPRAANARNSCRQCGRDVVFNGVDLDIPGGQLTYLLGPSGTGKSVLLKHIVGLIRPDHGQIVVYGEPLPYHDAHALNDYRKKFGVLFQSGALFDSLDVRRNVEFLRSNGYTLVGPGEGWLACRMVGAGRMSEPEELAAAVRSALLSRPPRSKART